MALNHSAGQGVSKILLHGTAGVGPALWGLGAPARPDGGDGRSGAGTPDIRWPHEPRPDTAGHGTTSHPLHRGWSIGGPVRMLVPREAVADGAASWTIDRVSVVHKHPRHQPSSGLRAG